MEQKNALTGLLEQRSVRLQKLKQLESLGFDPYPSNAIKDFSNAEIVNNYSKHEGEIISLTGRIVAIRNHGKVCFYDIKDQSGKIQVHITKVGLAPHNAKLGILGWKDLDLLDNGDFVQIKGKIAKTKRGEVSIFASKIRLLTKSLRPIPNKLKDKEERFRRRYLDININNEVKERFIRRSLFWDAHRDFLNSHKFTEINIPVLEKIPGGGDAKPFVTHMDSLNEDFYLRISHELPLKRLIGAGYEKVYDIGPRFRNEGVSDEHLPEHIAMEFYWAYADYTKGMALVKDLYNFILKHVYKGKEIFNIRGFVVDFSKGWTTIDFGKIMKDAFDIDIYNPTKKELEAVFRKHKISTNFMFTIPRAVDILWKSIRKDIAGPSFLINHPKYLSPLQKPSKANPNIVERFQPIIAGSELGNGWSEVNDPIDQLNRFAEQQAMRDAGDEEAQWLDIDFVEMLEYGMPPTFGYGHSERVFWFLEDISARDGVIFPQLRSSISELTKKMYPNIKFN